MRWLGLCALVLCACSVGLDYEQRTLAFDPVSPPVPGGGSDPVAASGTTLFLGSTFTRDDGATWATPNPAIVVSFVQISDDGQMLVNTTAFGYGRWDKTTDQ